MNEITTQEHKKYTYVDYRSKKMSGCLILGVQSAGFVRISCDPICAGECLSIRPDQEHPHGLCF